MMSGDGARVAYPLFQTEDSGSRPTSPLQLHIGILPSRKAMELNRKWHSRMPIIEAWNICNPCFGASFEGVYYAIAMWSLPIAANRIKNGEKYLELRRMAIAPDAPKNTASRMLAIMTRLIKKLRPDLIGLLSYQDTGVHTGTIYKAAGWHIARIGEYVSWGEHSKRPGQIEQSTSPKIRWEKDIR
jgi:hypothetical protein